MRVWQSTHPRIVYHLKSCQYWCGSKMLKISIPSSNGQYNTKKRHNVILKSSGQVWMKFHSGTGPAGANVRQPCSFTLSSLTLSTACEASPEQNSSNKLCINFGGTYLGVTAAQVMPFIAAKNKWDSEWRCTVMLGIIFQHCRTHRALPPAH